MARRSIHLMVQAPFITMTEKLLPAVSPMKKPWPFSPCLQQRYTRRRPPLNPKRQRLFMPHLLTASADFWPASIWKKSSSGFPGALIQLSLLHFTQIFSVRKTCCWSICQVSLTQQQQRIYRSNWHKILAAIIPLCQYRKLLTIRFSSLSPPRLKISRAKTTFS